MSTVVDETNRPAVLRVNANGDLKIAGTFSAAPPIGGATEAKQDATIAAVNAVEVAVNNITISPPVGGATEAKQDAGNTSLASIDGKLPALSGGKVPVTDPTALPLPTGAATAAKQDTAQAALDSINTKLTQLGKSGGREYETVAASATDQALGATGAAGDYIEGLLCVVTTAATSQVQIKDGAGAAITVFPNNPGAGVGSYYVPLGLTSTAGAWQVTTGAGVSVLATGDFT